MGDRDGREGDPALYATLAPESIVDRLIAEGTLIPTNLRPEGGTKHDGGKPRMDLVDPYALEQLAKVLTSGAAKYDAHNWRKGIEYSRLYSAVQRHLNAFWNGTDIDSESGLPHLAHAMCGIQFLLWHTKNRTDLDDRYKG